MNDLYIGTNGKLHYLIQRAEDIKAELDRQIEEDNYAEVKLTYFAPYTGE